MTRGGRKHKGEITIKPSTDMLLHNAERQNQAKQVLEKAKMLEQKYITKHVRIDSKTIVLKRVKKK